MTDKRYYWFKMEQSFFEQKEIKYLRRLPGGDTYTIIYLKLILKSLENDGKIYYENIGDDYSQEWALEIEEDEKAVSFLVAFLINKGLMIDCGFDEFEITKTKSLVGSETASAERKRRQRERERELSPIKDVTNSQESVTLSQVSHIEKDIEIEKDIDIELDLDKEKDNSISPSKNKLKNLTNFFESEFGQISPVQLEELRLWVFEDNFDVEVIKLAVKEASLNNKRTLNYVKGILRNWRSEGIETVSAVNNRVAERFDSKQPKEWTGAEIPLDGPWNK